MRCTAPRLRVAIEQSKEETMSAISGLADQRDGAGAMVRAIGTGMMRWWVAYTSWRIERVALGRLQAMGERQLKDMGLVRSQIAFAVKKGDRARA
jgi:uncharacterized protein YjiS (DUF1127 family)